jgi:hypothetical protein
MHLWASRRLDWQKRWATQHDKPLEGFREVCSLGFRGYLRMFQKIRQSLTNILSSSVAQAYCGKGRISGITIAPQQQGHQSTLTEHFGNRKKKQDGLLELLLFRQVVPVFWEIHWFQHVAEFIVCGIALLIPVTKHAMDVDKRQTMRQPVVGAIVALPRLLAPTN